MILSWHLMLFIIIIVGIIIFGAIVIPKIDDILGAILGMLLFIVVLFVVVIYGGLYWW